MPILTAPTAAHIPAHEPGRRTPAKRFSSFENGCAEVTARTGRAITRGKKAHNDHNVYILGAGFATEAGLPLIYDFMNRMRDAAAWLAEQGGRDTEVSAIEEVLDFRHRAAGATYRTPLDVENVEELFSLASARGGEKLAQNMNVAIAATIDFARATAQPPTEYQRFDVRLLDTSGWTKPQNWCAPTAFLENFIKTGNDKGQGFGCPPYEFYVGLMAATSTPAPRAVATQSSPSTMTPLLKMPCAGSALACTTALSISPDMPRPRILGVRSRGETVFAS